MITSGQFDTGSPCETIEWGRRLAAQLGAGDVVALSGDLGAGKTCFIKGLARGLGISHEVTSPTFTLIHEYSGGRLVLYHLDLYRLETLPQALAIGIEDYLESKGIAVIEWAEKIDHLLPPQTIRLHLNITGDLTRRIVVVRP